MNRGPFIDQIRARNEAGFFLCTGLDPDDAGIPPGVPLRRYLTDIVDTTAGSSACFKPNTAFYEWRRRVEPEGITGQELFADLVSYIHARHPAHPVIGDGKRADIGNTNKPYAIEFFEWFDVDALTTNPYFGGGALAPFFDWEGRGVIVMCRTSNPEAAELQNRIVEVDPPVLGESRVPLYQLVASQAANSWNERGNCGLVVGATAPEEAQKISEIAPDLFKLVPGIGDQGGQILAAMRGVYTSGMVAVFNVSRGIAGAWKGQMFPAEPEKFSDAAGQAARYYDIGLRTALTEVRQERGLVD